MHLKRQAGFSLIEISIVAVILLIAAVIGIPAINGYIIENKVPHVGRELQRFIAGARTTAEGLGATPYTGIGTPQLINAMRTSSVLSVTGTGTNARVLHSIGASDGDVTVAPGTLTTAGDAMTITVNKVNSAACPGLATVMQKVSESITINGTSVKAPGTGGTVGAYNANSAQAACTSGDTNTFVFVAR